MDGLMDGAELHVLTVNVLFHLFHWTFESLFAFNHQTYCPRGNLQDYIRGVGGCLDARLAKFYLAEIVGHLIR